MNTPHLIWLLAGVGGILVLFTLALTWLVCLVGWVVVIALPGQYTSSARLFADADIIIGQLLRGIAVDQSTLSA
mgnify:CR=1 FL=1